MTCPQSLLVCSARGTSHCDQVTSLLVCISSATSLCDKSENKTKSFPATIQLVMGNDQSTFSKQPSLFQNNSSILHVCVPLFCFSISFVRFIFTVSQGHDFHSLSDFVMLHDVTSVSGEKKLLLYF